MNRSRCAWALSAVLGCAAAACGGDAVEGGRYPLNTYAEDKLPPTYGNFKRSYANLPNGQPALSAQFGGVNNEWFGGWWTPLSGVRPDTVAIGFAFKGDGSAANQFVFNVTTDAGRYRVERDLAGEFAGKEFRELVFRAEDFVVAPDEKKKDAMPAKPDLSKANRIDVVRVSDPGKPSVGVFSRVFAVAPGEPKDGVTYLGEPPPPDAPVAFDTPGVKAPTPTGPKWTWRGWGGGGYFWSTAADPVDPDRLYMGGDVIGAYRSDDGGASWTFINNGLRDYAVYGLAASPSKPGVVYALTDGGVSRTDDGGEHWTSFPDTDPKKRNIASNRYNSIKPIAIHPTDPMHIYVGSRSGKMYRSTDGGESWIEVGPLPVGVAGGVLSSVQFDPRRPERLFATNITLGVRRSTDGGETWTLVNDNPAFCAVPHPVKSDVVYAALGTKGVVRSDDGGATWTGTAALPDGYEARDFELDPDNADVVHLILKKGWSGRYARTEDGGKSWKVVNNAMSDQIHNPTLPQEGRAGPDDTTRHAGFSAVSSITRAAGGRLVIAANWRNFISNDNGDSWKETANGLDITCFSDVRFHKGVIYASGMDEGLMASDDQGRRWRALTPLKYTPGRSGHYWRVLPIDGPDGNLRILGTVSPWKTEIEHPNKVVYSDDGGKTFQETTSGLPDALPKKNTMWESGFARALAAGPDGTLYLGIDGDPDPERNHPGGGLFVSKDGGKNWTRSAGQPGSRRMFYGVAVDPTDPKRIYWAACNNGGVFRSDDGGETWEHVFKNEQWVFNVIVAADGTVYTGSNRLWRSTDRGKTWKAISPAGGGVVLGLAMDPENAKRMWFSKTEWSSGPGDGGVWGTTDGGETWTELTGDLPNRKPQVLRYDPATKTLWAAGPGIYMTPQP